MYTLPFYTESDSLRSLASLWSAEPSYLLETTSLPCSFWLNVYSQKSPVVVVGVNEWLLKQGFIAQLSAAVTSTGSYIVVVTESAEEELLLESFRQGADRAVSIPTCSARIFRALINSLLPKPLAARSFAPYQLDTQAQTVLIGDQRIQLRRLVFELSHYLFTHQGTIVPKATLLRDLWGLDDRRCETRRVESHASLVKKQLQLDGTYGWRLRSNRGNKRGYGVFRVTPPRTTYPPAHGRVYHLPAGA